MNYPRVLCLGEILFDNLSDRPGKPYEEVDSWTPYPGGAPANVACALVKLGTSAGFIGCVGKDEAGDQLVKLLDDVGVDCTGVQRHETAPTRKVYVVRSETGDRSFAGFGNRDTTEFADTHLQADGLSEELIENADFLVLGSLELAFPDSRDAIERALKWAEQYDVKIVMDVNRRDMFWPDPAESKPLIENLIKRIDFLKISDDEAEWLFDTTDAGAITYRLGNVEGVLVTAGDKGCTYCLGENEGVLPAFNMEVVDTTGAGDGFVAGFIHQLCEYGINSLRDAGVAKGVARYASAVGALTTTKPGAIAAQPIPTEVVAFLASH
ncbi:carbohydrate kinase family protein [Phormidium sp. CCY1219]|uniref:carbohydrate kinase family protein n=1 Tax=Phormidium sp. CCY1219 TaxID=2886104 RepID=UPI002D1EEA13|nr:carbohydrate kinase [Phormidium sp. CCY1219]MEB3826920.1 carbohydrate kinase [Phormidium sp. CCY1219]